MTWLIEQTNEEFKETIAKELGKAGREVIYGSLPKLTDVLDSRRDAQDDRDIKLVVGLDSLDNAGYIRDAYLEFNVMLYVVMDPASVEEFQGGQGTYAIPNNKSGLDKLLDV